MMKTSIDPKRSPHLKLSIRLALALAMLSVASAEAQNPPKAIHAIVGRGIGVLGYDGAVEEVASSKRHFSIAVVPKGMEAEEVTLHVVGMDPGNYYLTVSGSDPRIVSATDMAQGVRLKIPAVVGAKAEALHEAHEEWTRRIEAARALAEELGLSPEEAPDSIKEAVERIGGVGEGLAETASARKAAIRVTPQDAGPVPLPFPKGISPEELVGREETLEESSRELVRHVAGIEEADLRGDLLDILVPIELGKVSGSLLETAGSAEAGTGELSFEVTNPRANPPLEVGVSISPPEGWKALGNRESQRTLAPGQSYTVKSSFELPDRSLSGRIAIPLDLTLSCDGIEMKRLAGAGFGHEFIKNWRMIGPFDNAKNRGTKITYPPEEEIDLDATYEGLEGTVGWKEVEATDRGYVDLKLAYEPNTNCLAYGVVWIYSPRSEPVTCASGSNDGIQVWMNGREVYNFPGERGAEPESDVFAARLKEGWNRLLVKSFQTGGNWGFYFELRDRTGAAASDWKFATLPPE
jgi:hypothetical protein